MNDGKLFDPLWRDDNYDEDVLDIPLALPPVKEPNNSVWVAKQVQRGDNVFGEYRKFKDPRIVTSMIKKNHSHPSVTVTDNKGKVVTEDDPVWSFLNPPKAWMSDSLEELMSMYSVAKEVRGEVLVGGLGMGIFPQLALSLDRPVDSFTIVDNNPDVIKITTAAWLDQLDYATAKKIDIVSQSFGDYIDSTTKKFDTIFVDIWEDADPRFLPYMNLLVDRLKPLCKEGGRIYIWAYALAVDSFVNLINFYESSDIDIRKIQVPIDPLLTKYSQWRYNEENDALPMDSYEKKARQLALIEKLTTLKYDRELYFSPHPVTFTDRQFIHEILSLARKD
ncbi:MAG: hypothetical protein GY757_59500 [bacterium]|nr:hypothetical protein [bacterium]